MGRIRNLSLTPAGALTTAIVVEQPHSGRHWVQGLMVAGLIGGALGGGVLAVDMLRGNNPLVGPTSNAPVVHVMGEDVPTSFGVIAVEHAVAISGLNDAQLNGGHTIEGLVKEGSVDVQVAAVISNLSNNVLAYQATQFELIDKTGAVVPISRAPQLPGQLQPSSSIDVLVDFVTTSDARPFTVRFIDPASKEPILIGLGAVGCTVQGGTGRSLPVTGGCSETPKAEDHTHG